MNNLLTVADLCRLFDRTPQTIRNWVDQGMPLVRIRGEKRDTIRFRQNEIEEWANVTGRRIVTTSNLQTLVENNE